MSGARKQETIHQSINQTTTLPIYVCLAILQAVHHMDRHAYLTLTQTIQRTRVSSQCCVILYHRLSTRLLASSAVHSLPETRPIEIWDYDSLSRDRVETEWILDNLSSSTILCSLVSLPMPLLPLYMTKTQSFQAVLHASPPPSSTRGSLHTLTPYFLVPLDSDNYSFLFVLAASTQPYFDHQQRGVYSFQRDPPCTLYPLGP